MATLYGRITANAVIRSSFLSKLLVTPPLETFWILVLSRIVVVKSLFFKLRNLPSFENGSSRGCQILWSFKLNSQLALSGIFHQLELETWACCTLMLLLLLFNCLFLNLIWMLSFNFVSKIFTFAWRRNSYIKSFTIDVLSASPTPVMLLFFIQFKRLFLV